MSETTDRKNQDQRGITLNEENPPDAKKQEIGFTNDNRRVTANTPALDSTGSPIL